MAGALKLEKNENMTYRNNPNRNRLNRGPPVYISSLELSGLVSFSKSTDLDSSQCFVHILRGPCRIDCCAKFATGLNIRIDIIQKL